jgi:hypothetical protein
MSRNGVLQDKDQQAAEPQDKEQGEWQSHFQSYTQFCLILYFSIKKFSKWCIIILSSFLPKR